MLESRSPASPSSLRDGNGEAGTVEIRGLGHTYRTPWVRRRRRVCALDGLDLTVPAGSAAAIVGPNGSGKTTLMRAILGLIRPTVGSVRVFGAEPGAMAVRRVTGYSPEEPELPARIPGRAYLRLFARLHGLRGAELRARVDHMIRAMDLTKAARHRIGTYSKGMRRRLSLAQAFVHEPRLVLLDEPFEGLDPIGCVMLREMLRRMVDAGAALIVTSHRLADIQLVADQVTVIDRGRVLLQGTTRQILRDQNRWELILEGLDPGRLDEVLRFVRDAGGTVVRHGRPESTLEDLFLRLLGPNSGARRQ